MATRRRRVVWALRARRAVDDALTYIADDSPQAAADLAARVIERAESLATLSERGRIVPELADPALRELIVGPYRLLYEVHGSEVWIVGFLHGRQDFGTWRRGQS
jgi:plasmid stabilization system protein ParE